MGGCCSKRGAQDVVPYDIDSPKFLDHYSLGDTLGRGAFGVVKAAVLKPEAMDALRAVKDLAAPKDHIARRHRFVERPLAVKVMRQERNSSEGDSCDKLEVQITRIEEQVNDLEKNMHGNGDMGQFEELQWLNEYAQNLKTKLAEKRRNQTKKTPRDMMLRETKLLEKCDHRFIMQFVETFEDNTIFCVIFERCYGSVASRYPDGMLSAELVARQGHQLLSAVAYLHTHFILHRDIKPENLMFRTAREDADVLLGDFGMAVELRKMEDRCQGCAGTPHFVPPEGFHSYYQSFPSDVWACGCSIYWMLLGECPFEVTDDDTGKKKKAGLQQSFKTTALYNMLRSTRMGQVLSGWKPQFEHDHTAMLARKICHPKEMPSFAFHGGEQLASSVAIDLLAGMLAKNPKDRLTAEIALTHGWFATVETENLDSMASGEQNQGTATKVQYVGRLDQVVPCTV